MTTRFGLAIVAAGVVLLILRAVGVIGVVDAKIADIVSVGAIVVGALGIAIDGEVPKDD